MPTSVQLPSTNLNNIESSSSQANTNLQALGKWNTTPEHIQQVTTNIEKQQQQQVQLQPAKESSQQQPHRPTRHHLPPVTRKTVLGPVRQARSGAGGSHHLYSSSDLDRTINYKAIYQPVPNPMATYSFNGSGQEWLVAKQRIQRPKDHDILTTDPALTNYYIQQQQQQQQALRPLTDADIRKQEFIERKIAQEQYRQELEHQIMQQKPVKAFKPKTTLRFEGESEFKTETKTNFRPFRFVTSLNDLDKRTANRKQSFEKEQQQQSTCCTKGFRPQSSLTTGGQFKEHLQCKPDPVCQQRRHLNQIENEQQQNGHYHHHPHYHHPSDYELQESQAYGEQDRQPNEELLVDENNNVIEQQRPVARYSKKAGQPVCCLCDHCREQQHYGVNAPVGSTTNQNQNELNPVLAPLVGVRALQANKQMNQQMNRIETAAQQPQPIRRKIQIREQPSPQQQPQQQHTNIVRSKSTHFQSPDQQARQQEPTIPRMIEKGKQKPHKNLSHLRFEGDQRFITTNNMMYRDHSMQNLSSYPDEDHLNRGVFAEQMMQKNDKKGTITGNMRGRVRNKYRDLFASSEDIFGNRLGPDYRQQQQQSNLNPSNRLSVKYKSAANLPQTSEEYERVYYADDQQLADYQDEQYEQYQEEQYAPDGQYPTDQYPNAYYQEQQLANEQNEDEQYDEGAMTDDQVIETTKQKKLIFIPKNQPPPAHFLNPNGYERRKDLSTSNSSYGSQLQCPALNLSSENNNYTYKYSIGGHKYFQKKSSIS